MDLDPSSFASQQQQQNTGAAFVAKQDPEKRLGFVEATATASALADISAIISQQFTNYQGNCDEGAARDSSLEHPCWEYLHKCEDPDSMICRVCAQRIKSIDSLKALEHFSSCHPQIAAGFEQSWEMKMQLKTSSVGRSADESMTTKESSERRGGHGTEHPCWRYFTRNRKSADCKMCGTHVAYACSGNLMRHLRSRHLSESVITQKEWEEIQKRKKQLCELRMMATANACGSEEQSPSNAISYAYVDEEQDEGVAGAVEEYDGTVENDEQKSRKESIVSSSSASDIKMNDGSDTISRSAYGVFNASLETTSLRQQQGSWNPVYSNLSLSCSTGRNAAFQKRINSFVSGLADELASFPMQKSLFCMRRIRKFMDEQLLELDEIVQNPDDDAGISE